jgi:hypothetical protein
MAKIGNPLPSPDYLFPRFCNKAQWVREAKAHLDLDSRLAKVLQGGVQLASASERIQLASFCRQSKQFTAAAVGFYADAFAQQPTLAEELNSHRYNAACAAAMAGCGQGKDTAALDEKERARLRQQALAWLHAEPTAWEQRMAKEPDKARADVLENMKHWQQNSEFAGVRVDAVNKLSESERPPWRKLWDDVEDLRRRAAERTKRPDVPNNAKRGQRVPTDAK